MYKIRIIFQKCFSLIKQNKNETKTIKNYNKGKYSERTSKSWLGRIYDYNYINSNIQNFHYHIQLKDAQVVYFLFFFHYDDDI